MITIFNIEYSTITSGADYYTTIFNILDTEGNKIIKYEAINQRETTGDSASRVGKSLAEYVKEIIKDELPYGGDLSKYEISFSQNMPFEYCIRLNNSFNQHLESED